jgi:hypothetical protein
VSGFDLFGDVAVVDDGARNAYDYYPTPAWMTRSLLHHHPAIAGATVLEPCAGGDAISTVLRAAGCSVATNDIDRRHPSITHFDATALRYWLDLPADAFEWVITNPPFAEAMPILQGAFQAARIGVAFLLRKTFLEPTDERGPWLQAHPPTRVIGQPRYSFRGTGSDSVSCDWMIWERRPDRSLPPFVIDHVAERRTR